MKMVIKEICLGSAMAVVVFLFFVGYNVFPLLVLGGLGCLLYFLVEKKSGWSGSQHSFYKGSDDFSFDDIGGQAPAKQELLEALNFALHADKTAKMGIRPLKGILLTGPPGTGKTLLAKAAANYIDSVFLSASGSEFIEVFAGVGAQRIRQLFRSAREQALRAKKAGAVIFIDEIDVLGSRRGTHAGHMEYEQTLNQLLVEMDGLKSDDRVKILVIGATNREDMLDPALLRPGRFDRIVRVDLPDKEARLQILKLHCRNKPLAEDVDLEKIARESFGFSGAHLESVANEAAILALRENSPKIHQRHFQEAVDKVMMGEKLDKKPGKEELYRIAVHETGHAVVGELLRPGSVSHLTVTSRGRALGYMRQIPENDLYLYTLDYLEKQIQVFLAGAVAEKIILGSQSTGATSDFRQAVHVARQIISAGLSPLGVVCEDVLPEKLFHETIQGIIKKQEQEVEAILLPRAEVLEKVAHILLDREYISGAELRAFLEEANTVH